MFKSLRILALLIVLMSVLGTYLLQQNINKNWSGTRSIQIIPVYADDKQSTRDFIASIKADDFQEIISYLEQNASVYNLDLSNALLIDLQAPIDEVPPALPNTDDGYLSQIWWSLKLRWWAWRHESSNHSDTQIRLFVMYQSPAENIRLPHSTGLRNGLLGLINARAQRSDKRLHNVILTHELLHIYGATDKYDLVTGEPLFPQGYFKPEQQPVLPQRYAELMGRSIPISNTKFKVAGRLSQTRIGELTAREIGWLE